MRLASEITYKSNSIFNRFLDGFFNDFIFILGAFWSPFGRQNRSKWRDAKKVRGSLQPPARQKNQGVPPVPQNRRQGLLQDLHMVV